MDEHHFVEQHHCHHLLRLFTFLHVDGDLDIVKPGTYLPEMETLPWPSRALRLKSFQSLHGVIRKAVRRANLTQNISKTNLSKGYAQIRSDEIFP